MVARHGLAAIAGVATEAALTYPLDTLKTLLQVSLISTFPIQMHMEFDFLIFSPFFRCFFLHLSSVCVVQRIAFFRVYLAED